MKIFKFTGFLVLMLTLATPLRALTGIVEVTLLQIVTAKGGSVKVGVFEADGFPLPGKGVKERFLPVSADTAVIRFTDLLPGRYAIAAFQDVDNDARLTKNLLGIPKEPYGFSNNVFGVMGPPDFENVSFDLHGGQQVALTIRLE